jgi:hypothetical protein
MYKKPGLSKVDELRWDFVVILTVGQIGQIPV